MTLSMYALKCNISEEELIKDSFALFDTMESLTSNEDNHFTEDDIKDSLKAFKESYRTFPRKDIEKLTGVLIPANKRNGLNQEEHLEIARVIQLIKDRQRKTNWRDNNGRPTKQKIIQYWKKIIQIAQNINVKKQQDYLKIL
ncbi:hypothetical protein NXS15_02915 [Mycoplasma sp. CSL7475-4]|uniref:hypothetical protein n=1 Tax=Mycoplasma sp. CSL7475-4 TaxID=2973942 RepID=UPI00216AFD99|nr:hypothetical protein [Mycoplasma sp. CSL7475-4]MCS4537062.1 hypothetical protein [Mycoplasma sp. CSL7475-4]